MQRYVRNFLFGLVMMATVMVFATTLYWPVVLMLTGTPPVIAVPLFLILAAAWLAGFSWFFDGPAWSATNAWIEGRRDRPYPFTAEPLIPLQPIPPVTWTGRATKMKKL